MDPTLLLHEGVRINLQIDAARARFDRTADAGCTLHRHAPAMINNLRGHGAASLVFAGALTVLAAVHATHGTFDDQLTSTADYLNDGSFAVALVAFAYASQGFGIQGAPRWALRLGALGALLVAAGVAPALATGESPAWFAAVGVPGNLLWLAGTIALARWAWRSRALPRWLAVGVGLTVPSALIPAEFGGSVIAAIVWAVIALRWLGVLNKDSEQAMAPRAGQNRAASATQP